MIKKNLVIILLILYLIPIISISVSAKEKLAPVDCGSYYFDKKAVCHTETKCNNIDPCEKLPSGIERSCPYKYYAVRRGKKDGKIYYTCSFDPVFLNVSCGSVKYDLMLGGRCYNLEPCNGYDMCQLFWTRAPNLYSYYGVTCPSGYLAETIGRQTNGTGWLIATCKCTDVCSLGATKCASSNSYYTCGDSNLDGCLDWGLQIECPSNQVCSNGICALNCADECTAGARQCSGLTSYQVCADNNADSCTEWGAAISCAYGEICLNGTCILPDNPPAVLLSEPPDNFLANLANSITFTCRATDDIKLNNLSLFMNISGSWSEIYTINSSSLSYTINNIPNGNYIWNCLAYDNASQSAFAFANRSFNVNVKGQVDNPPTVTLNSPSDNIIVNLVPSVTFTCSAADDNSLRNITIFTNITGEWLEIYTSNSSLLTLTIDNIQNGNYMWNCLAYDNASQSAWAAANRTFIVNVPDTTPPYVAFISPQSITYNVSQILINITASPDAVNIWWNNGTANINYTEPVFYTFTNGTKTITAYASDAAGNINSTAITFIMDIPVVYNIVINEFTTEPKTDWSESGTITDTDEWIELYNPSSSAIDLTGWTLLINDTSPSVEKLTGTINANSYLLILNPNGTINNDGKLLLYNSTGELIDSVGYGTFGTAPSGNSNNIYDECVARNPNGKDTDNDAVDFTKKACTFNSTNNDIIPPTISNIIVYGITLSSAIINWSTDEFSNTTVIYGVVTPNVVLGNSSLTRTRHSITLNNLSPNTVYYYNVQSCDASNNCAVNGTYNFTTAPKTQSYCSLTFNPNSPQTYPTPINASCSCTNPEASAILFRNSTNVTSENNQLVVLGAGTYRYECSVPETQNYGSASNSSDIIINKANSEVNLLLDGIDGDITAEVNAHFVNITGYLVNGPFNSNLTLTAYIISYPNFSESRTGKSPLEEFVDIDGLYDMNLTLVYDGDQNYTSSSESHVIHAVDTTPPVWSNIKTSPSEFVIYAPNQSYQFNISWYDNDHNSPSMIHSSLIEHNFTGTFANYSMTGYYSDLEWEYYYDYNDLPAGSYVYRFFANDSSGNMNVTPYFTYNVGIAGANITLLYITDVNYKNSVFVNCSSPISEIKPLLFRDGMPLGVSFDNSILAAGTYNYTCSSAKTQNYTSAEISGLVTVHRIPSSVILLLNGSEDNFIIKPRTEFVNITAEILNGEGNIIVYSEGAVILNSTSPASGDFNYSLAGTYNITAVHPDTQNYTSSSTTLYLFVGDYNIIEDSWINDNYYEFGKYLVNNVYSSTINMSILNGTLNTKDSYIYDSIVIDSILDNCTVLNSVAEGVVCINGVIDPSTIKYSNTTGTTVVDSEIYYSNVTYSYVYNSGIYYSNARDSIINNSGVAFSNILNSSITNSGIYKINVTNAVIVDDVLQSGTITLQNGTSYTGPLNLTDIVNYPPFAYISSPSNASSATAGISVLFTSGSYDLNEGTALNDSITYLWNFSDDGSTSTTQNTSHTFSTAGTFTVTLTVTDKFGDFSIDSITIFVNPAATPPSQNSGGGGGGGSYSGMTYSISLPSTISLRVKDKLKFDVKGTTHYITLDGITTNKIQLTISSDTFTASVPLGSEKLFDLTGDGKDDISIKYISTDGIRAVISVKLVSTAQQPAQPEEEPKAEQKEEQKQPVQPKQEQKPAIDYSHLKDKYVQDMTPEEIEKWKKITEKRNASSTGEATLNEGLLSGMAVLSSIASFVNEIPYFKYIVIGIIILVVIIILLNLKQKEEEDDFDFIEETNGDEAEESEAEERKPKKSQKSRKRK